MFKEIVDYSQEAAVRRLFQREGMMYLGPGHTIPDMVMLKKKINKKFVYCAVCPISYRVLAGGNHLDGWSVIPYQREAMG